MNFLAGKKLADIKSSGRAITQIADAILLLQASGALSFFKSLYQPELFRDGSDINSQALLSASIAGAHDVLEKLENFKEFFLLDTTEHKLPGFDFNALARAQEKGYLTEEEIHAIRHNTTPDYSKAIHGDSIAKPDTGK